MVRRPRGAPRVRPLTVGQQASYLRFSWPILHCIVDGPQLICTGPLKSTSIGDPYTVRIRYRPWRAPQVHVLSPELVSRSPDELIPHRYEGGALCLHFPKNREWRVDSRLDLTIIPWTVLWLFFYERWLEGDPWMGGGTDHLLRKAEPRNGTYTEERDAIE